MSPRLKRYVLGHWILSLARSDSGLTSVLWFTMGRLILYLAWLARDWVLFL